MYSRLLTYGLSVCGHIARLHAKGMIVAEHLGQVHMADFHSFRKAIV